MAIGTSLGAFFQDEFHFHSNPYLSTPEATPDKGEDSSETLVDKKSYTPTYWRVQDKFKSSAPTDDFSAVK